MCRRAGARTQTEDGAGEDEQEGLCEELADEAGAGDAEGAAAVRTLARGWLLRGELKAGDVEGGSEQNEGRRRRRGG